MRIFQRIIGYQEPHPHAYQLREQRVGETVKEANEVREYAHLTALRAQATVAEGRRRLDGATQ